MSVYIPTYVYEMLFDFNNTIATLSVTKLLLKISCTYILKLSE